jgi:hypothetical protein
MQRLCGNLSPPPAKGGACHVFISHAGEQKHRFVDFLREGFEDRYGTDVKVFVDEYDLKPGDAALQRMHTALGDAFVGKRQGLRPRRIQLDFTLLPQVSPDAERLLTKSRQHQPTPAVPGSGCNIDLQLSMWFPAHL